jgi:nickel-dependent lactate racemase
MGKGYTDWFLTESETRDLMAEALEQANLADKRVLIIIPDGTRTMPMPMMFRLFHDLLSERAAALDYLVALGTHPSMSDEALGRLVGQPVADGRVGETRIFNHLWSRPETFATLGAIPASRVEDISDGRLSLDVVVKLNRLVFDYDHIFICGPTFPHEVVGFSGGNKYFFPGISGPEMINISHWLGALITSFKIIGTRDTPVRALIDQAAAFIDRPQLCFSLVVKTDEAHQPRLAGLYIGSPQEAFTAAAELSSQTHILWVERPYRQVLSVMPAMYDDLWTGAKGMYKMEPVAADGGEVIIYAPHIDEISYTHGRVIDEVGYHVRDYFTRQWERFKHYPWGVLAHSTHVRGMGSYENGVEKPRIQVTLATGIPRERCERVNLGYRDPGRIDPRAWQGREDEGVLVVPKAGEMLYRLKSQQGKLSN